MSKDSSKSIKSETKYHLDRIAFAVLPNGILVLTKNDSRGHKEWLKEDFEIDDKSFEEIVRGYIKDNKVVTYIGSEFKPVNDDQRILQIVENLSTLADGKGIFDGVHVGKVGEEWEPVKLVRPAGKVRKTVE